jgi:acetylglutamate kinase
MKADNTTEAALIKALPHIRALTGRVIVVKYGGSAMLSDDLKAAVSEDILFMRATGINVVLVHGGGPEIEALLKAVGKASRFVNGLRYTDEETMEYVQMALAGKVNKNITMLLENAGARAVGLSGIDGALLEAERDDSADLGLVGRIKRVNTALLETMLHAGVVPVVSSVALGVGAERGRSLNVNADTAAAAIAVALHADKLVLMTDVPGILRDVHDADSLVSETTPAGIAALKSAGVITRGMLPKVACCEAALAGGVARTHIIDGRVPHSLLAELFSDNGIGTMITADAAE